MTATREILVTKAINGAYTARYSDYADVWTSPSGHGWTREQALKNLAIDAAYIAKHGTVDERIEREIGESASMTQAQRDMPKERIRTEATVPTENVADYVLAREGEGWRLDGKGKPQWHPRFKDNRVWLKFSRPA